MSSSSNRTIKTSDLGPETRDLVRDVVDRKCQVTIEEDGKPIAVVVPFGDYASRAARARVMETVRKMQKAANLSPEEADRLALEAEEAVRSESS